MSIRIHHTDTDDEVKERHDRIVKRLEELGAVRVRSMLSIGGLPTVWNPIIHDWLKDK